MALTGTYFSATYYLTQNADVAANWSGSALAHYEGYGASEGRAPNSWFDAQYYRANSEAAVQSMTALEAFTHYEGFGWEEGRAVSSTYAAFDEQQYLDDYADLVTGGITTSTALWHFLNYGSTTTENRIGKNDDGSTIDVASSATGTTYTLTTGADNIVGTTDNDTINGFVASAAAATSTLTGADTISGGGGTDVLNVTATGDTIGSLTLGGANISALEIINIRNVDGDGGSDTFTVSAATIAGVTGVYADRASDDLTVTGLAAGATIGMLGDGTLNNADVNFAYAAPTSAITIDIQGGTKTTAAAANGGSGAITATASAGVTTATIGSSGAANTVGVIKLSSGGTNTVTSLTVNAATNLTATLTAADFAATAALTVSGTATSVNLGANFDGKTIDASGLTAGGLTIATNTNLTSFIGGIGDDTVSTTALAAAAVAGAVDAGAGTGDVLQVMTAADVATSAKAGLFTNFEVLRNAGATDLDISLISGITSVQLASATAGATKLTAAQAEVITVLASNATNTIALADATGTSDVLGLNLQNATAAAVATPIDVTVLTADGFETINVISSSGVKAGGTGIGNDLAFAGADKLTTLNVSGAYDLTIAAANIAKAVTITSTQTGTAAMYVSGNFVSGSSISSSEGADAMILGTGFATYNTGAGNDTISGTAAQLNTGANYNTINGGDGTDTFNITGGAALTIVDNNLSKLTGIENIVVTSTVNADQSITTGGWFDGAFKANGVNLTTSAAQGNITIDMTSFTGAATLGVTTVGTGVGEGLISIQTGSGADVITVSAATAGVDSVVKTYAGNDKITTAGTDAGAYTGGAGDDTLVFGSTGVNTAVFEATAALNGADTITGFALTDFLNWVQGGAETTIAGGLTTTANVVYQLGGQVAGAADTAAGVVTAANAAATWTAAAATAMIVLSDTDSTALYSWTDVAGTAGVQEGELTLMGTVDLAMTTGQINTAITIV